MIDELVLAEKMMAWQKNEIEQQKLADEIKADIMLLKDTRKIGKAVAEYKVGNRKLDWETPGKTADEEIIRMYTESGTSTNTDFAKAFEIAADMLSDEDKQDIIEECTTTEIWQKPPKWDKVCAKAKLAPVVVKEGAISVSLKLK